MPPQRQPFLRASGVGNREVFRGKFLALLPERDQRPLNISWPTPFGIHAEGARQEALDLFRPEGDAENEIVTHPDFLIGITYGHPRPFHPEGSVKNHIRRALDLIDQDSTCYLMRSELRAIALIHDTFKYHINSKGSPFRQHFHAQLAERFAHALGHWHERVLRTILLHDFCFYIEESLTATGKEDFARSRAAALFERVDFGLYYPFTYLDRRAGDGDMQILDRFWARARAWGFVPPGF